MDAIKEAILSENNRDSLFDFNVLKRNLRKRTASDDFISALRQSKGLRFLLLANFHDAYLISFQKDIVYGKDALEFLIDFSGTFRLLKFIKADVWDCSKRRKSQRRK